MTPIGSILKHCTHEDHDDCTYYRPKNDDILITYNDDIVEHIVLDENGIILAISTNTNYFANVPYSEIENITVYERFKCH